MKSRKTKIIMAHPLWMAFFQREIQKTLIRIKQATDEPQAMNCYFACSFLAYTPQSIAWESETWAWHDFYSEETEFEDCFRFCKKESARLLFQLVNFDPLNPKSKSGKLILASSKTKGVSPRQVLLNVAGAAERLKREGFNRFLDWHEIDPTAPKTKLSKDANAINDHRKKVLKNWPIVCSYFGLR